MIKDNISLYTLSRVPLSLGYLHLYAGKFIEDIFDAVEDSENFEELDQRLQGIISDTLIIDRVTDRYIRYRVIDKLGNKNYLKIKIKEIHP